MYIYTVVPPPTYSVYECTQLTIVLYEILIISVYPYNYTNITGFECTCMYKGNDS